MRTRKCDTGFTLLELTCALFVITVAGFGAIQLYTLGLDKIAEMREFDVASEVLRNEIEVLRARPFASLEDGMALQSSTPAMESLHRPEMKVAVAPGAVPGLKEVTVSLHWQSRHGRFIERSLATRIAAKGAGGMS